MWCDRHRQDSQGSNGIHGRLLSLPVLFSPRRRSQQQALVLVIAATTERA
jgi:hypothetical protein